VQEIVQEIGRAVPTADLLHRLETRGISVGGKNAGATLHARLHGVAALVYTRPDGWNLRAEAQGADASSLI
jgi:hypothetical protein